MKQGLKAVKVPGRTELNIKSQIFFKQGKVEGIVSDVTQKQACLKVPFRTRWLSLLEQVLEKEMVGEVSLHESAFFSCLGLVNSQGVTQICMSGDFNNSLYSYSTFFIIHVLFINNLWNRSKYQIFFLLYFIMITCQKRQTTKCGSYERTNLTFVVFFLCLISDPSM